MIILTLPHGASSEIEIQISNKLQKCSKETRALCVSAYEGVLMPKNPTNFPSFHRHRHHIASSPSTEGKNRNKSRESSQIHTWLLCKGRQMKITGTWAGVDGGWVVSRISTACEGEHFSLRIRCVYVLPWQIYWGRENLSHEHKKHIYTENFTAKAKRKWRTSNIEHTSIASHYFRKAIIIFPSIFLRSLFIPFLIVDQNLRAENSKIFAALLSLLFYDNFENSMR